MAVIHDVYATEMEGKLYKSIALFQSYTGNVVISIDYYTVLNGIVRVPR